MKFYFYAQLTIHKCIPENKCRICLRVHTKETDFLDFFN